MCGPSGRFTPSPRLDLPEATDPSHGPASPENAGSVRSRLVRMVLAAALALASPVLARGEQCPDDGTAPVRVEVTVTAVPIVVTSTTADYFVLYAKHDVDGTEVELPVLVKLGEVGTTTLAENVPALPANRYRVEKYQVDEPADIDGDCTDDITELNALGTMNPVNPAAAVELTNGAVAVPDRATFDTLTQGAGGLAGGKFIMYGMGTDRPGVYFINVNTFVEHDNFLDSVGLDRGEDLLIGHLGYRPEVVAPNGGLGLYYYWFDYPFASFPLIDLAHSLLTSSMSLLDNNVGLYLHNVAITYLQPELPLYRASRIDLVFQEDISSESGFQALNPGVGYGLLRSLDPDDRPHPRDVALYEALPNELPRVAGIISTVPQTPLSHVNLRAVQDGIPNAYIRDALDKSNINALIGSYVRYEVTENSWKIQAATPEEVEAHYASSRPDHTQTPEFDLSVTGITPLSQIGFEDWKAFGVKAANLAVLGTLGFPTGTVPDGFAIPFYFYDEFMKAHDFYTRVGTMLANEDFQTDFEVQDDRLDDLRDDIKDAETPQWIKEALTAMHAQFPEATSLRYRSSTNNEDLPGFNGAGLYDSKTQHPEETEEDGISKSLKQVFASLWTFRAFTEREFHRIDHLAAKMGVLVHPNYSDELANGVATSFDPISGRDDRYYVNTQVGEDLVTNPEAHSVPEEILLDRNGRYSVLATSNLVERGQLLMSNEQLRQLREHLEVIHDHFEALYNPAPAEPFAMEIEFKITSENILAIKQARPWVFEGSSSPPPPPPPPPPVIDTIEITSNPGPDATYAAGDTIEVTVTFDETVAVTRMPQLTLNVGGVDQAANYGSGTGAALVFAYPVADSDLDTDGVSIEANRLSLNGGTIKDGSNNNAVLDHDGLAADSGHKVDGVRPRLAATGGAVVDGTRLTLTYDEALDGGSRPVSGDFTVSGGSQSRTVTGVRVSGSTVELTLNAGAEHLETGILVSYTPGMNPIRDVPGNEVEAVSREPVRNDTPDTTSPEVSSVAISSNPGSDQTYAAGDEIEVMVTFSETVEVEGTPQLRLRVGTRTRTADYLRGTDTAALVFGYEVVEGDEDSDGVSIEASGIALNRGAIKDEAENSAELAHGAVAPQAGHTVDGVRPSFLSAAVDGSSLTLTYGEGLDGGSRPASGDFTVEVDGSGRSVTGVSVSGSVVTLTLNPAVEHGDTGIRVSYTVPTGVGANPIQDAVGNDARGLNNQSVTNTTGAPNTGPEITTQGPLSVGENQALVRRLAARDTDAGDEVTGWEIVGGADRFQFSVSPDTGELSFQTPPDYEDPTDEASTDPPSGAGDNEYVVTVEVRSGAGVRELEAEQTFTIRVTDEREPPEVPEAPTFSGETADSLEVNWSEPDNTGPPITDYDVQYREKGTGRFIDGDQQGPGRTLTLEDLEPGTVYEVQVRAKNDEGTGDWSESGEGMTVTPLTLVMASGTEPPVSGPFTVRFSFSEPVTGFSGSDIETGQDPACVDDQNSPVFCDPGIGVLETADDRVFTTTVSPWTDRVAHSYTLRLTVAGGAVRSSVGSKANEEPEEPLAVRVAPPGVEEPISSIGLGASSGSGSVRLSWNLPSDNGGSAIIRYEVRYQAVGEAWSEWENVGAGVRGVTVGNLINGREYSFEVRAVNGLGKGGAETVQATPERRIAPPPPPPPGNGGGGGGLLFPPEAPAGLMAMPGNGTVRLEWSPPASDGGTPILRYQYRLKEERGEFGEWTRIEDSAPDEVNATGYTVGELGNGTVYVFELRAVNLVGGGRVSEAVEVVMGLDRAYWSNFLAGDLQGIEASLERGPFGGGPQSVRLRFGADLRFEESELDGEGEGEVRGTRMGGYGYRYTSRTTGELSLDYDGGKTCELQLTFRGEGAGSYSYRCGGVLGGQGSFRMSGLNRAPEITSAGAYEVAENTARVGRIEAVDGDDEIGGYGIAGGADGGLFAVEAETGELMFREAPDYEIPGDVESEEPQSRAADNEYIVVVEVRSGEGERERKGSRAIRVQVSDEEELPEITSLGPFEVVENRTRVGQLEAVDQDKQDEITEYGIAGGADGGLFAVEAGELLFREAPDYETPGDVASDDPQSGAGDNEYIVVVEVRSGEGERERKGRRAIRVRVSDEEEPPEITSVGPFEVVENQTRVGQLEAVDQDKQDEITEYGIAGGADGGLFAVETETGELMFRKAPDYEDPSDVESEEPASGAADNEYIVVVEVRSGEGERERKGSRAIRVRVADEEEPPEITSLGPFEVVENRTRVGQLEAVDQDKQDEITEYGIAGGADGGLFEVEAETGELMFREAPDYEDPSDVESAEPASGAADNEYIVVVEVRSGEGERERKGSRAIRVRVSDEEEPPGAPAAPVVTAEGSDSLKVSWREPENRGPEIVDYEVRYREGGEAGYSDGGHEGRGLEVRLSGLKEGTVYEVQVRAVNEEGISEWSEPGEGRTDMEEPDPEEADPEDPSDFTEGDLEGRRLTLRLEGEEGSAGSLELWFGEGNRFDQIESVGEQVATRTEGASRSGSYSYERTGPGMGTVRLAYDDGASCEIRLSFTGTGVGGFVYDCGGGSPAEGSFRLTTGSLFVPVILSSAGQNQSFFTSELTLTNRGEQDVKLDYSYTADRGGGSGTASDVLAAGRQKVETDALTYLIGLGVPIPEEGNRIGTLRVEVRLGSEVEAVVRTTTVVPDGRAGLAYPGVAEEEGFEEAVYLCGLRQNNRDRSNVAFQNMGAPEEGAITVRTTVYSGEAADATARVLKDVTLEPGGFHQYSGLLGVLGVPAQGYVKVERVEGRASFYAYGVINDQANSDGSFVFPVAASWLEGTAGQTLPVVVETSAFTSELTVTNFSEDPRNLDFQFVAEGIEADDKTAAFSMRLEAGQQHLLADVVEELRRQRVAGLGSTRGFYTGPLFVLAKDGDMSGIVIGARTGSKGGGGQYSVFYNAVPEGEAFAEVAWVDGLQQNEENRSNLALVNTGEVDGSPSVFHLEIYDGETGLLAETVVTKPIPARRWHQINGILGSYAPETRQGYIRIEKVSGENPFLAYGVVNDGGAPGERSGDGAYLPARE